VLLPLPLLFIAMETDDAVLVGDAGWRRRDADAVFALPRLTAAACVLRLLQKYLHHAA
jgi:hypothetical protein